MKQSAIVAWHTCEPWRTCSAFQS